MYLLFIYLFILFYVFINYLFIYSFIYMLISFCYFPFIFTNPRYHSAMRATRWSRATSVS
jgi:hypothetical protein